HVGPKRGHDGLEGEPLEQLLERVAGQEAQEAAGRPEVEPARGMPANVRVEPLAYGVRGVTPRSAQLVQHGDGGVADFPGPPGGTQGQTRNSGRKPAQTRAAPGGQRPWRTAVTISEATTRRQSPPSSPRSSPASWSKKGSLTSAAWESVSPSPGQKRAKKSSS